MGQGKRRHGHHSQHRPSSIGYLMTVEKVEEFYDIAEENDWEPQKWVQFCAHLMAEGFTCHVREAQSTVSKYITVQKPGSTRPPFKVRFSNHLPNAEREKKAGENEYFVGITHLGRTNTGMALGAVHRHFKPFEVPSRRLTPLPPPPPNWEDDAELPEPPHKEFSL